MSGPDPDQADPASVRAFLDANVLFSAARRGRVSALWSVPGVVLVTSEYALLEAWRNLAEEADADECLARLDLLMESVELLAHDPGPPGRLAVDLPDPTDVPILAAASKSGCDVLVTGDSRCFGGFFGQRVEGVLILTPRMLLESRGGR